MLLSSLSSANFFSRINYWKMQCDFHINRPENPEPSETELKRADLFFNDAYALVASRAKLDDFTIEVQVGTSSAGCG